MILIEIFIDLCENYVLLVAMMSWIISQMTKFIINVAMTHEFSFERLTGDGGMPSGHSATVSSTMVMCGWIYGFDSVIFGLSFVLAIIVMHDAHSVRREAGKHAVVLKDLADAFNRIISGDKDTAIYTDKLKKFIGHTPAQVAVGCTLGILIAFAFILVAGIGYGSGDSLFM